MKDYFDGIETFDIDELLKQVHKLPKDWFDLELLEKHLTPEQRAELQKSGFFRRTDENARRAFT